MSVVNVNYKQTQKVSPYWVQTVHKPVLAPNFIIEGILSLSVVNVNYKQIQKVSPYWVRTVHKPKTLMYLQTYRTLWYQINDTCITQFVPNWFSHICKKRVQYLIERSSFSSGGPSFRIPVISFPFFCCTVKHRKW